MPKSKKSGALTYLEPLGPVQVLRKTFTFINRRKDEKTIGYRISQQLKSNVNIVIKKEIDYIGFNYHGSEFVSDYIAFKYY